VVNPLININKSVLIALGDVKKSIAIDLLQALSRTFGILFLLLADGDVLSSIVVYSASAILAAIVACLFSTKSFNLARFIPSYVEIRNIISIGITFTLASLGMSFLFNIDRIMIGGMSSMENVGYYSLISTLANTFLITHRSMSTAFKPYASMNFYEGNREELIRAFYEIGSWSKLVNALIFVFFNLFSIYLLSWFTEINDSYKFVWVQFGITSFALLFTYTGPSSNLLQMIGGHRKEMFNTLSLVLGNILLNFALIPFFDIYGAAIATLLVGILRTTIHTRQIRDVLNFTLIPQKKMIEMFVLASSVGLIVYLNLHLVITISVFLIYLSGVILNMYSKGRWLKFLS
jgi:O-antigen/teichoic acid export membrane protein